jgi:hypothetical protein
VPHTHVPPPPPPPGTHTHTRPRPASRTWVHVVAAGRPARRGAGYVRLGLAPLVPGGHLIGLGPVRPRCGVAARRVLRHEQQHCWHQQHQQPAQGAPRPPSAQWPPAPRLLSECLLHHGCCLQRVYGAMLLRRRCTAAHKLPAHSLALRPLLLLANWVLHSNRGLGSRAPTDL